MARTIDVHTLMKIDDQFKTVIRNTNTINLLLDALHIYCGSIVSLDKDYMHRIHVMLSNISDLNFEAHEMAVELNDAFPWPTVTSE